MLIEKFAVATAPETTLVDFGTAVPTEALRRGLGRAKTLYLVMDGAVWLWELAENRFGQAVKTLDFHHARDHLWALAHALHGEDDQAAREWVQPLMRSLRDGQENQLCDKSNNFSKANLNMKATPVKPSNARSTISATTAITCTTKRWKKKGRPAVAGQSSLRENTSSAACEAAAKFGAGKVSPTFCNYASW